MKRDLTKYPLRKVIGHRMVVIGRTEYGYEVKVQHELLECGHTMSPRQDIYGEYYATRRRCTQCPPK